MKFALLLCTHNVPNRTIMYEDVIHWWINNSSYTIFIVDSSNNKFSDSIENNLHIHHFDQNDYIKQLDDTFSQPSVYELLSLKNAYSAFGSIWKQNYDYVIKLTCKYKLPSLQTTLSSINTNYSLLLQSIHSNVHHNTEIVIFKSTKMYQIVFLCCRLIQSKRFRFIENVIYYITRSNKFSFQTLIPLINIAQYNRAWGDLLTIL